MSATQSSTSTTEQPPSADGPQTDAAPQAAAPGVPRAVLFWGALLMVLAGVMGIVAAQQYWQRTPSGAAAAPDEQAPKELPAEWIREFTLTERSGQEVGSQDLRGKVWVANFFFARCPGSCRQQSMLVSSLQRDYREQDVRFVSITCDPKNDTPAALREYAHGFDAPEEWWFLTGDLLYIRRIGAEFFQLAVSEAGHQDRLAVVDKWGQVRGRFNWHDELQLEKMRDLIAELQAERQPPAGSPAAEKADGADGADGGAAESGTGDDEAAGGGDDGADERASPEPEEAPAA